MIEFPIWFSNAAAELRHAGAFGPVAKHRHHCARYPEAFRLAASSDVSCREKAYAAGPVDHLKRAVDPDTVKRTYAVTEAAFAQAGGTFKIVESTRGLYEAA
jgi:hypothetical protein